jgi:hypothetical protein
MRGSQGNSQMTKDDRLSYKKRGNDACPLEIGKLSVKISQ